jgi:hypothetical protein
MPPPSRSVRVDRHERSVQNGASAQAEAHAQAPRRGVGRLYQAPSLATRTCIWRDEQGRGPLELVRPTYGGTAGPRPGRARLLRREARPRRDRRARAARVARGLVQVGRRGSAPSFGQSISKARHRVACDGRERARAASLDPSPAAAPMPRPGQVASPRARRSVRTAGPRAAEGRISHLKRGYER